MSKPIRYARKWVALIDTPVDHPRPCLGCVADGAATSKKCNALAYAYGVDNCRNGRFVAFKTEEEALTAVVIGRLE